MQRAVSPTPRGTLLLVLHAHLPWVLGHGRWPHGESWLYEAAAEFYDAAKVDFLEKYNRDLLAALKRLQQSNRIEIIVSAATHGYLPLLGRDESIEAQLGIGITSYRRRFGRRPRGIWLPECAYRPGYTWSRPVGPARAWLRPGLEEFLARKGLRYFFVDTHLVAGGAPIGTYEDRLGERRLDAAREGTGLSPNEPYAVSASRRRKVGLSRGTRGPASRSGAPITDIPETAPTWNFTGSTGGTASDTGGSPTGASPWPKRFPTIRWARRNERRPTRSTSHPSSSTLFGNTRRPRVARASSWRPSTRNSLAIGGLKVHSGWSPCSDDSRDKSKWRPLPPF